MQNFKGVAPAAFFALMGAAGSRCLYLDAVGLTIGARMSGDSGHTGVAVHDTQTDRWIQVDPTWGRIVTLDWDPHSTIYAGPVGRFWIWYRGDVADLPAKDHEQLKAHYRRAMEAVPAQVWDNEVEQIDYTADPSTQFPDGSWLNPRLPKFIESHAKVADRFGVHPKRHVNVTLLYDETGHDTGCHTTGPDTFQCNIVPGDALQDGFFCWLEGEVARKLANP